MGFPVGYPDVFLPKVLIHALSLMGFIRSSIVSLFTYLGLSDFLETDTIWPDYYSYNPTRIPESVSAALIREILPVVRLGDLADVEIPESCAVCLCEFENEEEIRRLCNCKHIFHRTCLDRWIDHDQKTCPLCRTQFVPDDMRDEFIQRLLAATGITTVDYNSDFSSI